MSDTPRLEPVDPTHDARVLVDLRAVAKARTAPRRWRISRMNHIAVMATAVVAMVVVAAVGVAVAVHFTAEVGRSTASHVGGRPRAAGVTPVTALITPSPATRSVVAGPSVAATEPWLTTIRALDDARAAAMVAGDAHALEAIDVPGSPADAADRELLRRLIRGHLRPDGYLLAVTRVVPLNAGQSSRAGVVTVRVDDRRSAFVWRDGSGHIVARVPARGRQSWSVDLRAGGPAQWRVWSVTPLPTPTATNQQSSGLGTQNRAQ